MSTVGAIFTVYGFIVDCASVFLMRSTFLQVVKCLAALPARYHKVIQMRGQLWDEYSAAEVYPRNLAPVIVCNPKAQPKRKGIPKDLAGEGHADNELYRLDTAYDLEFMRQYLKINGGWRL